ncbi:MAG: right-handed parallel beta-helix repeat-containing protein, partial [Bdellovibrionales bacterium]|nr:right-handed parallel beta-helix repeat-containing protein [Oligoflexia bacterium]
SHTLKVTAYSGSDLSGTAGPTYTVHFNVTVLSSGTPTPTPVPTATPIATATPAPTSTPVSGGGASTAEPSSYSTPIVISRGGTYSGNWRSTSVDGYAVKVATSEPVIIENSHLAGPGTLIDAVGASSNITVRNSSFHGYTPNVDNRSRGRAIDMTTFKNAVIENNFFENTGEVIELNSYVGNQTTETVKVRYNRVKNINMKYRNSNGAVYGNFVSVGAFMQGNPVNGEIGWNEVINEPGKSVSEDLINFSFAGGKSSSWFTIHDNYLKGSYHGDVFDPAGSAGGIQIDGEDNTRCAYIEAYGNSIAQIMNGGMGAAAGRHIYMHDNRVISSGKDASGRWFPASYAAAWGFAAYKTDPNPMTDIRIENNVFGWGAQGYQSQISGDADRQDYDATGNMFGSMKNNTEYKPGSTITEADQDNEYQLFRQKVQAAGLHIGP